WVLCPHPEEPPAWRDQRARRAGRALGICAPLRSRARPFPRPLRRPGRHRRLHGQERSVRRRARLGRDGLCRTDGQGLGGAGEGQGRRQGRSLAEAGEAGAEVRLETPANVRTEDGAYEERAGRAIATPWWVGEKAPFASPNRAFSIGCGAISKSAPDVICGAAALTPPAGRFRFARRGG